LGSQALSRDNFTVQAILPIRLPDKEEIYLRTCPSTFVSDKMFRSFLEPCIGYRKIQSLRHVVGSSRTRLNPLKQGLGFEPCEWKKKVLGRGDPTIGGQPGFLAKISYRQSRWILRTNIVVIKIFLSILKLMW